MASAGYLNLSGSEFAAIVITFGDLRQSCGKRQARERFVAEVGQVDRRHAWVCFLVAVSVAVTG